MSIYEYRCKKCGDKFDVYRPLSGSDEVIKCPKCGADNPKRLLSIFASRNPSCGATYTST